MTKKMKKNEKDSGKSGKQIGDRKTFILTLIVGGSDQDMSADEQMQLLADVTVLL